MVYGMVCPASLEGIDFGSAGRMGRVSESNSGNERLKRTHPERLKRTHRGP
jgi:hypothetical protein